MALEYRIEAARELAVAIPNQHAYRFRPFGERPRDLPRLLRHPFGVRVGRASGQVDASAGDLDKEQHVHPLEPDGVDREEIDGDDAFLLRAQELTP